MVAKRIDIVVAGDDQASAVIDRIAKVALVLLSKKALDASVATIKLGASSLAARDRLTAMAGGAKYANDMLAALQAGADNTINRLDATTLATRLLEQGLVSSGAEMELTGAMISKLGNQTWTTERRVDSLTMLLANQSKRRLDDFGLSVANVTARQKELVAAGYSTEQAFKTAVFEEANEKLGVLGDTSELLHTKLQRVVAVALTAKQRLAEMAATDLGALIADVDDLNKGGGSLVGWLEKVPDLFAAWREERQKGWLGRPTEQERRTDLAMGLGGQSEQKRKIQAAEEARLNAVLVAEIREVEAATRSLAEAEEERATARAKIQAKAYGLGRQRQAQERQWARQTEDFHRSAERAEQAHQERVAEIIASGAQSAAEKAQEVYDARLKALNEAMRRELEALAAAQERRGWNETLEKMEQDHQDRMAAIRKAARETERERETKRYDEQREAMRRAQAEARAALDEQQRAEEEALRRKYGKGTDPATQREAIEEEHRRRMKGLYTKSARDRERQRYEQALKELKYQEELAAMRKRHANEQKALEDKSRALEERAEARHKAELKKIRDKATEDALEAERQRYRDQVNEATKRRDRQQQDAKDRKDITDRYAQLREEAEVRLAERMAEIQTAEIGRRLRAENDAYAQEQEDQRRHFDRMEEDRRYWLEAWQTAFRKVMEKLKEKIDDVGRHLERPWGTPGSAQHGTNNWRGGPIWVGEAGKELLNLPSGSSVTPHGQSMAMARGGGGVVVNNYYGPASIRSDRDITRMAAEQERSLRLRGVRTV